MPLNAGTPGYTHPTSSFADPVPGDFLDAAAANAQWDDYTLAFDTLAKKAVRGDIAGTMTAAEQGLARVNIGAPAIPIGAAAAGQWSAGASAVNGTYTLPGGGTWAYWLFLITAASGGFAFAPFSGIAAGGTVIAPAAGAGQYWVALFWRIS